MGIFVAGFRLVWQLCLWRDCISGVSAEASSACLQDFSSILLKQADKTPEAIRYMRLCLSRAILHPSRPIVALVAWVIVRCICVTFKAGATVTLPTSLSYLPYKQPQPVDTDVRNFCFKCESMCSHLIQRGYTVSDTIHWLRAGEAH